MVNRLANESSPYLRQHARNPVDWYPWSDEAFALAKREDRPVFLSVGYSTCHWCHVMEHESFESQAVADVLNAHFVPIKVDREERPDVDRVYMLFVQATTGAGGWPMSIWLTPDLEPFYGGTYFPPTSQWGRPGFLDVLSGIARVWREDRDRVVRTASSLVERLRAVTAASAASSAASAVASDEALLTGARELSVTFDRTFGGFGGAPKFPRPSELFLLLRAHARTGEHDLLDMVLGTLRAMSLGGMRDHVGGGFHRYAVDAAWRVPHFEKMLYDQAQIVLALLEACQASGDAFWGTVAADTLAYVQQEMTHPEGGFYSAEDADSVPPEQAGQAGARPSEGAFYLWSAEEIDALLGPDAEVVRLRFGIEPGGNAPHDPQGEFGTKNIPYTARSIEEVAERTRRDPGEVGRVVERARAIMAEARRARPRPHLDDKVLTSWNGLMIAAVARASRVLGHRSFDPDRRAGAAWLESARRAATFVRRRLWDESQGRLLRRFRDGVSGIEGYCEDYACLVWGLLELFQADGDPDWLEWALRVQDTQNALFWDAGEGGWFSTTGQDPAVLLRLKEDHDGAEPAASSVSVLNELQLAHLAGGSDRIERVGRTLARFGPRLGELARSIPLMVSSLGLWHDGGQQIVIVGPTDDEATRALRDVLAVRYLPFAVVVPVTPGTPQARMAKVLPFVGTMTMRGSRPTAYVCRNFACLEPVTTPEALDAALDSRDGPPR